MTEDTASTNGMQVNGAVHLCRQSAVRAKLHPIFSKTHQDALLHIMHMCDYAHSYSVPLHVLGQK